jgi:hypothetical protein
MITDGPADADDALLTARGQVLLRLADKKVTIKVEGFTLVSAHP